MKRVDLDNTIHTGRGRGDRWYLKERFEDAEEWELAPSYTEIRTKLVSGQTLTTEELHFLWFLSAGEKLDANSNRTTP